MKKNMHLLLLLFMVSFSCRKIQELPGEGTPAKYEPAIANKTNINFPPLMVSTVAGQGIDFNQLDGFARYAELNIATALAIDASNNIIFSDFGNHSIRKLSASNTLTTLAGNGIQGFANGAGCNARFSHPEGILVTPAGDVLVYDHLNYCIRKITPSGIASVWGASGAGFQNGPLATAKFQQITDMKYDAQGNIIVCDRGNNAIRKISPAGIVSTIAGNGSYGSNDGPGSSASFFLPYGVAVDAAGNMYVADGTTNFTIRKISAQTNMVTTLAGATGAAGYQDGPLAAARFYGPTGIVADAQQNILIADAGNHCIRKIDLSTNMVSTVTGSPNARGYLDGSAATAQFSNCTQLVIDNNGDLIIGDQSNYRIRKLSNGMVTTLAGNGKNGFQDGNATGTLASLYAPWDVGVNANNDITVGDYHLREISCSGVVSTLNQITSPFYSNMGVFVDAAGNKLVTKQTCVFRVSNTGIVSLIAGDLNSFGNVDANGPAARFGDIRGVVADQSGNIYVADYGNFTIRKIDPFNNVTTYAGLAGSPGAADGIGSNARFFSPWGLDIDNNDNLYVADGHRIRVIGTVGMGFVSTLLDNGANVMDIANDGQGNLVFTSWSVGSSLSFVKKRNAAGVVSVLAGNNSIQGFLDGPATTAQFNTLYGITIDKKRNILVADPNNGAVRKISGNW
jgi:streptogramin lyase